MTKPTVSVVLPVYNGANYVKSAVESILNQTLENFEFIIINDGSKDNSQAVLESISDPRIRLYHQENKGLAATLNLAISKAKSNLIARQDQDDLSKPKRLELQYRFMTEHNDCALLGTAAEIWVGEEKSDRNHDHPTENGRLIFDLMFNNPFVHSSVMLRKEAIESIGGYTTDPERQPPEDYELWSRVSRHFNVFNLEERLLVYREVPQSMSRAGPNPFLEKLVMISAENIASAAKVENNVDCQDLAALTHSAKHLLSKKLDIKAMVNLIESATQNISMRYGEADLTSISNERIRILNYQYVLNKTNTGFLKNYLRQFKRIFGL